MISSFCQSQLAAGAVAAGFFGVARTCWAVFLTEQGGYTDAVAGDGFIPHSHPQHQLAWARRGVLGVAVGDAYWVLPRIRALWLPAGVVHRIGATRDALLCSLYFEPDRCDLDWTEPTSIGVDGLLAHLIAYLSHDTRPMTRASGPRRSSWIC